MFKTIEPSFWNSVKIYEILLQIEIILSLCSLLKDLTLKIFKNFFDHFLIFY